MFDADEPGFMQLFIHNIAKSDNAIWGLTFLRYAGYSKCLDYARDKAHCSTRRNQTHRHTCTHTQRFAQKDNCLVDKDSLKIHCASPINLLINIFVETLCQLVSISFADQVLSKPTGISSAMARQMVTAVVKEGEQVPFRRMPHADQHSKGPCNATASV